ncbi:MAG: hypothetical protein LBD67_10770, partial [Candidatus Accumulibacter sp.]|nr:hypothetical protein [Accumulibacter sp.]
DDPGMFFEFCEITRLWARPFMLRQAQHERREALLMRFDRLPSTGSGQPRRTDWEGYLCFGKRSITLWTPGASVHASTGSARTERGAVDTL